MSNSAEPSTLKENRKTNRTATRSRLPLCALALAWACSDPVSPIVSVPEQSRGDLKSKVQEEWVRTPAGLYHSSCVHEIASGAKVDANRVVHLPTGATYQIPACQHAPILSLPPKAATRPAGSSDMRSPALSGWIEWTSAYADPATTFRSLEAKWFVPSAPTGAYTSGKTFFTFPGLNNNGYINQPVLQYGSNGRFGGSFWTLASWHCSQNPNCYYSTPFTVSVGNSLKGNVTATNCGGGMCDWTITARNETGGWQTVYTFNDTDGSVSAVGGAVEVYNLTSCNDFPASGAITYFGISLFDQAGQVTPTWYGNVEDDVDPWCNFRVGYDATSSTLYWVPPPPFSVSISGKQNIARFESAQYTATTTGGTAPFTYQWRSRMGPSQSNLGPWSGWYSTGSQNYTYFSVSGCGIAAAQLEVMATGANSSNATGSYYIYITNPC